MILLFSSNLQLQLFGNYFTPCRIWLLSQHSLRYLGWQCMSMPSHWSMSTCMRARASVRHVGNSLPVGMICRLLQAACSAAPADAADALKRATMDLLHVVCRTRSHPCKVWLGRGLALRQGGHRRCHAKQVCTSVNCALS